MLLGGPARGVGLALVLPRGFHFRGGRSPHRLDAAIERARLVELEIGCRPRLASALQHHVCMGQPQHLSVAIADGCCERSIAQSEPRAEDRQGVLGRV